MHTYTPRSIACVCSCADGGGWVLCVAGRRFGATVQLNVQLKKPVLVGATLKVTGTVLEVKPVR